MLRRGIALMAMVGLGACSSSEHAPPEPALALGQHVAPLMPANACGDHRWIGATPPGVPICAAPGPGWASGPLFGPGAPGILDDLCLYTWQGAGPPDLAGLPHPDDVHDLSPDCATLTGQGSPLAQEFGATLSQAFEDRVDAARGGSGPGGVVRVAVVDTAPTSQPNPRAMHGPLMGALIEQLYCAGLSGPCPLDLTHHLAMPYVDDLESTDFVGGGHFGSPGYLAEAIHEAVAHWQATAPSGAPLIINLSVGWVPEAPISDSVPSSYVAWLTGANPTSVAGPVRAVHAALLEASCQGALVVAASGNDPAGVGRAGALLPARWERLAAPTSAECATLGLPTAPPSVGGAAAYRPLVHGAGGVDMSDNPLPNGRANSRPRLVADGFHVAARDPRGGDWEVLSGTSASAAVVSATMARVWSHQRQMAPSMVAEHVYQGAEALHEGPASVCLGHQCPAMRRVSMCRAEAQVAPGAQPCNPPPIHDATIESRLRLFSLQASTYQSIASSPGAAATQLDARFQVPDCGGEQITTDGSDPTCAEAARPAAGAWPALVPQPEDPMCPVCTFDQGNLSMYMSKSLPASITDANLVLYGPTGQKTHYALHKLPGLSTLKANTAYKVSGLAPGYTVKSAWLTFSAKKPGGQRLTRGQSVLVLD